MIGILLKESTKLFNGSQINKGVSMFLFGKIKNLYIKSSSEQFVKHLRREGVAIGKNVRFISPRSNVIDLTRPHLLTIGNNVRITHGVILLTHGYEWFVLQNVNGREYGSAGELTIGNNVFIGMNSILLKGVTVGSNVVIGVGSIVSRDIPDNSVVMGNPAKVLCSLDEFSEKYSARQLDEAQIDINAFCRRYGRFPEKQEIKEFTYLYDNIKNDPEFMRSVTENPVRFKS